ncbi:MAG: hypothetical protein WCH60_18160 [Burkholderiales bacterium]
MQSSLKVKLLRNLGANPYGQLITIAIQLVSVPLYLHYWGVALYGEWLILSAIPAYLALSDIGFVSVALRERLGAAGYVYAQAHLDREAVLQRFEADVVGLL